MNGCNRTPLKRLFFSEASARRRLEEIIADPKTAVVPVDVYCCPCASTIGDHWFLTHLVQPVKEAR